MAAGCGCSWLGGQSFLGSGGRFHGQSMLSWSNNIACSLTCHVIVIMVGGGCEWWQLLAMAVMWQCWVVLMMVVVCGRCVIVCCGHCGWSL